LGPGGTQRDNRATGFLAAEQHRESRGRCGAQNGVTTTRLRRQDEIPGERRATRELDHVARVRAIERRLEIAAGPDTDGSGALDGCRHLDRCGQRLGCGAEEQREGE